MQNKNNSQLYLIIVTGILIGLPALITDTYLPSFPSLAEYFKANASTIQMSLMPTMVGIGNILYSTSIAIVISAFVTLFLLTGLRRSLTRTENSREIASDEV